MIRRPPRSTRTDTLFPYTTLFRSGVDGIGRRRLRRHGWADQVRGARPASVRGGILPLLLRPALDVALAAAARAGGAAHPPAAAVCGARDHRVDRHAGRLLRTPLRSEERRVGKECVSTGRSWGSPEH